MLVETQQGSRARITLTGRTGQVVDDLGVVPRPSGGQMTFSAATDRYVAFVYNLANDETASFRWKLYLWDRQSKKLAVIARNPVDKKGNPLHGGWIHPVLTSRYLYWITAAPSVPSGWGGSALEQYDLRSGKIRTLYRGLVEAFVPYGTAVLYTALIPHPPNVDTNTGAGAPEKVYAVDQATGAQIAPPAGITAGADGAAEMQTDGDIIVWNAALGALRAWRPSWGRSISLIPQNWDQGIKDGLGAPADPRLYGHFLIWQPGQTFVLDLRTNSFARVTPAGTVASGSDVAGHYLSLELTTTPLSVAKSRGAQQWDQYLVDLEGLPDLRGCR